jgi:hypothetical protein
MQWEVLKFNINYRLFISYYMIAHRPAATVSLMIHSPSSIISHPSLKVFSQEQYEDNTA